MKILVVEDEESIAAGLKFNFEQEGYEVDLYGDGPSALQAIATDPVPYDLLVLDLMLPGMSGYEICRTIRETNQDLPILVLSARTLSEDKVYAFDCGIDQYLTKPFALPELLSRVRNLLDRRRRRPSAAQSVLSDRFAVGRAVVNFRTFEILVEGQTHPLTTMEVELLRYFLQHEGAVLSRQRILKDVWDQTAEISTRTVDNFVMRLRRYVEEDPSQPRHLLSVRGTGYRFVRTSIDGMNCATSS
jgi:two-component system OmpR family response regulator